MQVHLLFRAVPLGSSSESNRLNVPKPGTPICHAADLLGDLLTVEVSRDYWFLERDSEKRRAQGNDFRTFLNGFVADLTQCELPAHSRFTTGATVF